MILVVTASLLYCSPYVSQIFIERLGDTIETPKEVLHTLHNTVQVLQFDIDHSNPAIRVYLHAVLNWTGRLNCAIQLT